ncbi:MAG: hypothetical protein QM817_07625 [Archangium sp.]
MRSVVVTDMAARKAQNAGALELIVQAGLGKKAPAARVALRELPAKEVGPALVAAMSDARDKVRAFAVEFGPLGPDLQKHVPLAAMLALAGDSSARVRLSLLTALNRGWGLSNAPVFSKQAAKVRPVLKKLSADADAKVAKQAAVVLERYG